MHDDPLADPAAVDRSDILGTVLALPDQLRDARDGSRGALDDAELPGNLRAVLVGGMGGSAMAGEIAAAWAGASSSVPIAVQRGYHVPAWVGEGVLVPALSYSGNTEETLAMAKEALDRGATVVAVTSGGRLQRLAEAAGAPVVHVPPGFQPRAAVGHLLVGAARALEAAGLVDVDAGVDEALAVLETRRAILGPEVPAGENEAKAVALALEGSRPVIYGSGLLAPAARRFAGEIDEMAKTLAFFSELPEMNHNEIVGWSGDDDAEGYSAVFLRHDGEHPQVSRRFDFLSSFLAGRGVTVVQLEAEGKGPLARLLSSIYVGDTASVYLAVLRGVDPTPVTVIEDLKENLAASGFRNQFD